MQRARSINRQHKKRIQQLEALIAAMWFMLDANQREPEAIRRMKFMVRSHFRDGLLPKPAKLAKRESYRDEKFIKEAFNANVHPSRAAAI